MMANDNEYERKGIRRSWQIVRKDNDQRWKRITTDVRNYDLRCHYEKTEIHKLVKNTEYFFNTFILYSKNIYLYCSRKGEMPMYLKFWRLVWRRGVAHNLERFRGKPTAIVLIMYICINRKGKDFEKLRSGGKATGKSEAEAWGKVRTLRPYK